MFMKPRPALLRREALRRRPVQARSLEKRRRVKAAALACFRQLGYEATSIELIAARARVAVGGVYLHFKSKRQLLLVLMDELVESLAAVQLTPSAGGHPREAIRALLTQAFDRDLEFLGAYRAWREAILSDPELARRDAEIHRWTEQRVGAVFSALQQLPGARRNVDVAALAALMDRFFWTLLAEALRTKPGALARSIDTAADVTYHALFEDTAGRRRR